MLKYTIDFKCFKGDNIRIEIDSPTYTGVPISLIPTDSPLIKDYQGNNDDNPFLSHLVHSTITLGVVSTGIDLNELMYINDASFKCRVYINTVLDWQGYLISDGIQEHDSGIPYDVTIKAIDGIQLLPNTTYELDESPNYYKPVIINGIESAVFAPIDFLRYSLYWYNHLDNKLPIRWNTKLKSKQYPSSDMVAGLNTLGEIDKLIKLGNTNVQWIVENLSKASQSWLYQSKGYWYFTNYFDVLSSGYNGYQITDDTTIIQTATEYNEDEIQQIAMSDTINQSWWWYGKKPLGSVSVQYNSITLDNNNVIPNGGFDTIDSDWRLISGQSNKISYTPPLNTEYNGHSIQVDNTGVGTSDLLTFGSIPLDSNILFKYADLGFIINPVSGFIVDGDGVIQNEQIRISVKYTGYENGILKTLYLNEFGFWEGFNIGLGIGINSTLVYNDRIEVFFIGSQSAIGQLYNISYEENFDPLPPIYIDQTYVFTSVVDFSTALSLIASNTGGTAVGNRIIYYANRPINQNAYITGSANNIKFINFEIQGIKQNDITSVQFQSKGNSQGIKIPDCGVIDPNMVLDAGRLSVDLFISSGVKVQFDDLYFRVSDNKDVYELKVPSSKNSQESYELGISSSFSGHMVSNIMDSYADSNKSLFWDDDKSLTELYGTRILNWRNKPRKIFSGDIDKVVEWGLFELKGLKYAPLSISTDYKNGISKVVGIEIGENSMEYDVTHKSSGAN